MNENLYEKTLIKLTNYTNNSAHMLAYSQKSYAHAVHTEIAFSFLNQCQEELYFFSKTFEINSFM